MTDNSPSSQTNQLLIPVNLYDKVNKFTRQISQDQNTKTMPSLQLKDRSFTKNSTSKYNGQFRESRNYCVNSHTFLPYVFIVYCYLEKLI